MTESRIFIVTGANLGIGKASAMALQAEVPPQKLNPRSRSVGRNSGLLSYDLSVGSAGV